MADQKLVEALKKSDIAFLIWKRKHRGKPMNLAGAELFEPSARQVEEDLLREGFFPEGISQKEAWELAGSLDDTPRGLDLTGVDLSGADLRGARLFNAVLVGANLTGAQLDGVRMEGANLQDAKIQDTILDPTNWAPSFLKLWDSAPATNRTNLLNALIRKETVREVNETGLGRCPETHLRGEDTEDQTAFTFAWDTYGLSERYVLRVLWSNREKDLRALGHNTCPEVIAPNNDPE